MKSIQEFILNEKLSDSEKIMNIIKKETNLDSADQVFLLFKDLINYLETEMEHKEWEEFVDILTNYLKG